jgi:hypothetical protein
MDKPLPPFLADMDRRVRAVRQSVADALAECQEAVERVHRTLAELAPDLFPPLLPLSSPDDQHRKATGPAARERVTGP